MKQVPRILCVDTSGTNLGCLLTHGDKVQNLIVHKGQRDHCKNIVTVTDELLQKENTSLDQLDGFACIIGPGSFTGLRIGLMTAKTFAHIHKKPLMGINTFERMVQECHSSQATYFWPAQKGHVYATRNPLGHTDDFVFGTIDELTPKNEHIYYPQGFELDLKNSVSLPFEEICGRSLAGRVYTHWSQEQFLDIQTSHPLYVQEVAAIRNL